MTKERIEIIRQSLIPFVKKELLKINYEGLGKSDAEEFEKDLNEVLDLASKALEQQPSEDCVSRAEVLKQMKEWRDCEFVKMTNPYHYLEKRIQSMSPVTPTRKVGKWIKEEDTLGWNGYSYQCSVCGRSIHLDVEVEDLSDYPYCHCGVEMEIDEDGKWIDD